MFLARCPFCTHTNPSGARFCNECGSPLYLRPCEHCEAVNDVLSRSCHRCGAPLRPERQRESVAPAVATAHGDAPEWEPTTVAVAYGEEGKSSGLSIAPWRDADEANARESFPTRNDAATLEPLTSGRREPFVDAVAPEDDADRPAARRVPDSVRQLLTFVTGVAIVAVAVLGGYTFLQRGAASVDVRPSPAAVVPASPQPPRESAPPDANPPDDASLSLPQASSVPPPQQASPTDTGPSSATTPNGVAAREAPSKEAVGRAASTPPRPERKPATPPSASQDAIETQRIITRELGGFAPAR
jgi:hypothetical protein